MKSFNMGSGMFNTWKLKDKYNNHWMKEVSKMKQTSKWIFKKPKTTTCMTISYVHKLQLIQVFAFYTMM